MSAWRGQIVDASAKFKLFGSRPELIGETEPDERLLVFSILECGLKVSITNMEEEAPKFERDHDFTICLDTLSPLETAQALEAIAAALRAMAKS